MLMSKPTGRRSRHVGVVLALVLVAAGAAWAGGSSLTAGAAEAVPMCFGMPATIVGTAGDDTLTGTPGDDVIVGLEGTDVITPPRRVPIGYALALTISAECGWCTPLRGDHFREGLCRWRSWP